MKLLMMMAMLCMLFQSRLQAQCPPARGKGYHVVQKGETLYRISKTYHVTVEQLSQWNNLAAGEALHVCRELKISGAVAAGSVPASKGDPAAARLEGKAHTVKAGETVESIARLYGLTEWRFREINKLAAGQKVSAGTILLSDACNCPPTGYSQAADVPKMYDADQPAITTAEASRAIELVAEMEAAQPDEGIYVQPGPPPASLHAQAPASASPAATVPQVYEKPPTITYTPPEEVLIERKEAANQMAIAQPATIIAPATVTGQTNPAPKPAAAYLTAVEADMVNEINILRTAPAAYLPYVEAFRKNANSERTVDACRELENELKNMVALAALEPAECLYRAAQRHAEEQRPTGMIDHTGNNGSYPWDRVRRSCSQMTDGNENLVSGPATVRDAVLLLLVDDATPSRSHRRNLMNRDWKYVACYKAGQVGATDNNWIQVFGQ